jgi:glycolate oxidase iron-sulfur subunit
MAVDAVVTTAAGCGAMLQACGEILDDATGIDIATRARDVTSVLAEAGFPTAPRRIDRTVTYHDPCHLAHAQGVREAPRDLLRAIPGLDLIELSEADTCCGSAGTYNVTEPRMSRRLMVRKTAHILRTGAAVVATPNPGCLLQIRAGLMTEGAPVKTVHPLDLLAEAHLSQPL